MSHSSDAYNETEGAGVEAADQPVIIDRPDLLPERPRRVLVSVGDRASGTELAALLTDLGYSTLTAADGHEAMELARSAEPEVAIVDLRTAGPEARDLYMDEGVPVVVLSPVAERDQIARAVESGVFGYLVKPVSREQLRATLEVAWRRFVLDATERCESAKLRKRLEERKVVEQAKWILVSTRGMTEPDAMRQLQKQARSTRRQLIDVASEVLRSNPST
jgi:response regulator NasT